MKKFAQTSIRPKGVGKTVFESIMNTNDDEKKKGKKDTKKKSKKSKKTK